MAEKLKERKQDVKQDDLPSEELEAPAFIDNRIDVKAATVVTLEFVMRSLSENDGEEEDGKKKKKFKFNLLTNFGIVEGAIVRGALDDEEPEDRRSVTEMFHYSMEIRNDQLQKAVDELDDEPLVVNNTGAILVEDATITPFANPSHKIHMEHLYLFTDQITGVTASF